jgi:hypothetical protein
MKILDRVVDLVHDKDRDTYSSLLAEQHEFLSKVILDCKELSDKIVEQNIFLMASVLLNVVLIGTLIVLL